MKTGDKLRVVGEIIIDYSYEQTGHQFQKMEKKMIKCLLERNKKNNNATPPTPVKKTPATTTTTTNTSGGGGETDEVVYFFEETKGKFSPIARLENISGVHRLEDLVKKFRFPITVQLVYGKIDSRL